MGFHYPYNASGAHRWTVCHAFKALSVGLPPRPSGEAARIGTAAHYLAEWALTNGYANQVDEKLVGARIRINPEEDAFAIVTGPGAELGAGFSGIRWADDATETTDKYPVVIKVNESMVRGVSLYTRTISGILEKYGSSARLHVEVPFELAKDMGGMADCVILVPSIGRVIVVDYKNGRMNVNAIKNPQMAMYGVGALSKFASTCKINDVVMAIVQPNAESGPAVKTWTQTVEEMRGWRDRFEAERFQCIQVEVAKKAGKDISGHCTTGPHCKWCPASVGCPGMHNKTMSLAKRLPSHPEQPDHLPAPVTLDDARLLWVAENGDAIIDFVEQCRAHMVTQAEQGKRWPGYKLVEAQTRRRFKVDKDLLEKAFREGGHMEAFEPKLKPLSKLEKIFGADKMAPYIEKPKGKLELVPEDDGRPEHGKTMVSQLPDLGGNKK